VHVNLALALATSQETVRVTGTLTTVDTSSSTAGTTLDTNQIANLPVNGRDVSDFLEIAPGSVASTGFFQGSVNGMENIFTGLNITLDGQSAMRGDINGFLDTEARKRPALPAPAWIASRRLTTPTAATPLKTVTRLVRR